MFMAALLLSILSTLEEPDLFPAAGEELVTI
jgi:hypothetical protein